MVYNIFGWVGSICFAISGAPQALLCYKQGHSRGVSNGLLVLWFVGEVGSLVYAVSLSNYVFILNYAGNLVFLSVIAYYKLRPRVDVPVVYDPATRIFTVIKSGTYAFNTRGENNDE